MASETRAVRVDKFRSDWGLPNCEQAFVTPGLVIAMIRMLRVTPS